MTWLLWKEYRLNRLILILAAALLIAPYAFVSVALAWRAYKDLGGNWTSEIGVAFQNASVASLMLGQLAIAFLGGNAIAGERADRSAEFQAGLPIPRWKILSGKLILAMLVAAVIWGPNLLVFKGLLQSIPPMAREELSGSFGPAAVTAMLFFCVSWLLSSLPASSSMAVLGGLLSPIIIMMGIAACLWWCGVNDPDDLIIAWYYGIGLTLSPLCLAAGTGYYLYRVEP
ncbi:MAG: hypothetical protein JW818_04410 [Pirellulales bacterium]|nr:hypothetical protein [Pirellulales bacterium]